MTREFCERFLQVKRAMFEKVLEARLNPNQREAVCTVNGPLLVLAGAGSGKTTVLVRRIAFLIQYGDAYYSNRVPDAIMEEDVVNLEAALAELSPKELEEILPEFIERPCPPYAVLAITFTNKAAGEIKERLAAAFGDRSVSDQIWSGTFHSVCMRILRKYTAEAGLKDGFSIYDTNDKKHLVSDVMKTLNIDEKVLPVRTVMNVISQAKDRLQGPSDLPVGQNPRDKMIVKVFEAYEARLKAANAVDFDDIILKTVRLLETCPDAASYYQNKFRYVCVDEYQDTNVAQFRLTELLSAKHRNIMVVGDDDQSIYKFRGATIENILQFDKVYPDAKVVKLEQNYRSTANILEAANAIIANNTERHDKKLWCAGEKGEPLSLRKCEDQNGECRYVVDRIVDMVVKEKRHYRDFAILYRVNELARGLETAFAKSGIPYRVFGSQRFYDRKEIRDMVAYLYVLCNPDDDQRLLRIINEPKRKIGNATMETVAALALEEGTSLYRILEQAGNYPILERVAGKLFDFVALIISLREFSLSHPVSETVAQVFEKTGYKDMLKAGGEAMQSDIDSVEELISAAQEYEKRTEDATLQSFLEETALVSDVDKYDEAADACVLMTIHSAKGLEFPVVFLVGMEEGIFPGMQSIMDPSELSEERRLAYVAVTRAKERVFITHVRERLLYGRTTYNKLSRFVLDEVPAHLIREDVPTFRRPAASTHTAPVKRQTELSGEFTRRAQMGTQPPLRAGGGRMTKFGEGDRVRHSTFGTGTVRSAKDMGGDMLYEVEFDSGTVKKLMGSFARLQAE